MVMTSEPTISYYPDTDTMAIELRPWPGATGDANAVGRRAESDLLPQAACRLGRGGGTDDAWRLGGAFYGGHEPVADARHRLDVALPGRPIAERPPQRRDVVIEVVLFNGRVGPDALHQLVLRQQAARMFDQQAQGVEYLRAEGHGAALVEEPALAYLEAKRPEFVGSGRLHRHFRKLSEKVHSGYRTPRSGLAPNEAQGVLTCRD